MRTIVLGVFCAFLSTYSLVGLDREEATFLLNRAGLGATEAEVRALEGLDRAAAVDALLAGARQPRTPLPTAARVGPVFASPKDQAGRNQEKENFRRFQAEWYTELAGSRAPLRERMTVFWHNHFTSSFDAVKSAAALARQHETIATHALGNFRQFTDAMTIDPAMMVYLDTRDNKKGNPNENFGRELLELFVLGEGNYTEADVVAAARALTGLSFDPATGALVVRAKFHDADPKTIFGQTAPFDRESLLALVFEQAAASRLVPQKLAVEFWGREPSPARLDELAQRFRETNFEIEPLVRDLLLAEEFWSDRSPRIRSPLEFYLASVRAFDLRPPPEKVVAGLRRLGQGLDEPLSVKGWPVGSAWIDVDALALRRQAATSLKALVARGRDGSVLLTDGWQFK